MPILDIGGKDSHPVLDRIQVFCAMAYPRDEAKRLQYWASFTGEVFGRLEDQASKGALPLLRDFDQEAVSAAIGAIFLQALRPFGGIAAVSGAPGLGALHTEMFSTAWAGSVAGDVLIHLVQLHAEGRGASVNKAVALSEAYLEDATSESGEAMGRSARYVRQQWEHFRPVAHLWAAYRLWFFGRNEPEIYEGYCLFTETGFPGFLGLSEEVLRQAAAIRPHGRQESVIDPRHCWTAPPDYPMPTVTWEPPPLSEDQLAALRRYKSQRF